MDPKKEFMKIFESLCVTHQAWQVWSDLMSATACSLANSFETDPKIRDVREKEFQDSISRIGDMNAAASCAGLIAMALEDNPDQDFLGQLFMELQLGSHWHGQFFTPANVARMMARIGVDYEAAEQAISENGYFPVVDPACGAGATLVSAAAALKEHGINYQEHVLFVGQDIDRVAGMMCYIQLSLLGCPGYVCVADTLRNPCTGASVLTTERKEGQEYFFTPMYYSDVWQTRQLTERIRQVFRKKPKVFKFYFDEKEEMHEDYYGYDR